MNCRIIFRLFDKMSNSTPLPYRRSIRLCDYDYAQEGAYFVTICVYDHVCLLGDIIDGAMQLNDLGLIVAQTWDSLPARFLSVELDAFVVMPNHVHGIIVLTDSIPESVGVGLALPAPIPSNKDKKTGTPRSAPTLGDVVGAFKSISAIGCNRALSRTGIPFWQRNYYEHVIRHEDDLNRIRDYIMSNPAHWAEDQENPLRPIPR
jgi:REP element-mobilizing transposase RayT